MKRFWKRGLWLLVAAGIFVACSDWSVWDALFDRSTSLSASVRGWSGGDGAVSSALPGTNRAVFLFGDSLVSNIDSQKRPGLDNDIANTVFGNTIGVLNGTDAPNPSNIRFYGRKMPALCDPKTDANCPPPCDSKDPRCLQPPTAVPPNCTPFADPPDLRTPNQPCPIQDLTTVGPGAYTPFFDHKAFGLNPKSPPWGFWPNGSYCLGCQNGTTNGKLVVSFAELLHCDPFAGFGCFPMCDAGEFPCHKGVRLERNVLATVSHADSNDMTTWVVDPKPAVIESDVQWGGSFVEEGGLIYIYGTDEATQSRLFVARTSPDKLTQPGAWEYWSFTKHWEKLAFIILPKGLVLPNTIQLGSVADGIAPLANVTRISRYGVTGYVLVYTGATNHFLYVRTSQDLTSFPSVTPDTPKVDLAAIDKPLQQIQTDLSKSAQCFVWVHNGETDLRNCGKTVHGRALDHLSGRDAQGQPQSLTFSYVVPSDARNSAESASVYRPRFGALPLDNLFPWCNQATCWKGIARMYPIRPLAHGAKDTYQFDVTKASRLRVELLYGSGDPDLFVRFDSPAAGNSSDTCSVRNVGDLPAVCDLPTAGHTTAHVQVYGAGTDNTYLLRAIYSGD